MEISLMSDSVTVASIQGLGYANSTNGALQISAGIAPPPIKSALKTIPRRGVRRKRRTRRRSMTGGGDSNDWEYVEFFGGDNGDGGGSFGWGGIGGGGGWNFYGFGWSEEEEESDSPGHPAYDFVFEAIYWIALSNCVHFAFNEVLSREKVPLRFPAIC